jgi:hypothetical protein
LFDQFFIFFYILDRWSTLYVILIYTFTQCVHNFFYVMFIIVTAHKTYSNVLIFLFVLCLNFSLQLV